MKYVIIPYIALGFTLSLVISIEYTCTGQEMFPEYYGSPFVFKAKSLGSSMEYFYSIWGLALNICIWSSLLGLIRLAFLKLTSNRTLTKVYKFVTVLLIGFSSLTISIESIMIGHGFQEGLNYWYFDLNKEATSRNMKYEGKWEVFGQEIR